MIAVLAIESPVIFVPLSIVIPIVAGLTPESVSVTFQVIVGLLFVKYVPAVGAVMAIIGATFSFTCKRKDVPRVASAASFVVMFPATSVAFTVLRNNVRIDCTSS